MSVKITYYCNGCFAETTADANQSSEVVSRGHMIGGIVHDKVAIHHPSIENSAPEGWVPYDPYTGMTYCPECWGKIESGDGDEETSVLPEPALDSDRHREHVAGVRSLRADPVESALYEPPRNLTLITDGKRGGSDAV